MFKTYRHSNLSLPKFNIGKFYLTIIFLIIISNLVFSDFSFSQEAEIDFSLDINSHTIPLPKIFRPHIDLSGRGLHPKNTWPQGLAAEKVLRLWKDEIGFNGIFRLQYNLWEIYELAKNNALQDELLLNYDRIIREITESGGTIILNLYSTPAGLGKALDKKSAPWDFHAFKELVKRVIRMLSCEKRYNVWYEVWSAPDLDEFFLGRKQDYLNLYRMVAECIKELEQETKINIPIGGPSTSWWFQNFDGNTILTPERSLIYELIRYCYAYRLPLDFISWHSYSTDPKVDKELTIYNKNTTSLIRDWLSYFRFDKDLPLIVTEWNYDSGTNILPERHQSSYTCASYILSRLRNMYEAGINYQTFFSLEDFQNNKEGVARNTGVFWYSSQDDEYKGVPKVIYNVFKMLDQLGNNMFLSSLKMNDEYVGVLATRLQDGLALIIYNYIDPQIGLNYISRSISALRETDRRLILSLVKSGQFNKILAHQIELGNLQFNNRVKNILKKALELNDQAQRYMTSERKIKITLKNFKQNQQYQRYTVDSSCSLDCAFLPQETKEISIQGPFQETLSLKPYSVHLLLLKNQTPKPKDASEVAPTSLSETEERMSIQ
ncbi:MAG: hypothetical protein NC908_04290 [Candidatus Omnitrophica bacterium]|nr:hypothetical protein [Candidatus Omnitrophota bacterium]